MAKRMLLGVGIVILAMGSVAFAQTGTSVQGDEAAPVTVSSQDSVNAGNKICPVSGEKIDEKLKATYEYEGKIYNFCCAMCIDEFKKDPQKYIKKVDEERQLQDKETASQGNMAMPESQMPSDESH